MYRAKGPCPTNHIAHEFAQELGIVECIEAIRILICASIQMAHQICIRREQERDNGTASTNNSHNSHGTLTHVLHAPVYSTHTHVRTLFVQQSPPLPPNPLQSNALHMVLCVCGFFSGMCVCVLPARLVRLLCDQL